MFKKRLTLWLIVSLTILGVFFNLPSSDKFPTKIQTKFGGRVLDLSFLAPGNLLGKFPLKLGLDLQGGTELVLQTQMDKIASEDKDSALESARQVIEKRVNLYGVSEALVQSSRVGDERRILVELPGVKDLQTAVDLVGKTAQLDFRELQASAPAEPLPPSLRAQYEATAAANFVPTGLGGADLKKATVIFGNGSSGNTGPQVQIDFTEQGGQKFADITKRNVGKPLGIFLDDQPVSAPIVQQEIDGGTAVVSGQFSTDDAKNLAIQLNAGALPVPIKILQQRTIAATLGSESIQKSVIAAAIGIITVMIYMLAFYGVYGVVADLALIIYSILVLAIFRTGFFIISPITLTLAGIAGFVLSIGMAVDANILTFERMKEELQTGVARRVALEHGFNRAWTSIKDSNISSLITATILYIFGTSLVRGFALTLAIGVLVSMFSAVVVTRTFLRLLPRFKK